MSKKTKEHNNSLVLKKVIENKKISDLHEFIKDKNSQIQAIIRSTIVSIKRHKNNEIFSDNDVVLSINILNELYEKTKDLNHDADKNIEKLQKIIDKLSMVICGFGTETIDDLLFISFGSEFLNIKTDNDIIKDKYALIRKYVHPIGYKIVHWKQNRRVSNARHICSNKIIDTTINLEDAITFECFDADPSAKTFYQKIYGIRVIIQNETLQKAMIINGIIDDIQLDCFSNSYIDKRMDNLKASSAKLPKKEQEIFQRILGSLTFKDILVSGDEDIYKKMIIAFTETNMVKNTKLDMTITRFLEMDMYNQRSLLVNLLINNDYEMQYISYLLYDLISVNSSDNIDTSEQVMIYDSLPWKIKTYFKDAIKYSIKYTHDIIQKYDINKISLEQQIYLLKVNDNVKEKAMTKLKEVKNKSDEMGNKARQYLEGLIKIPFGVYKEEAILKKMKEINETFSKLITHKDAHSTEITKKNKYTNVEMIKFVDKAALNITQNAEKLVMEKQDTLSIKQLSLISYYVNTKSNKKVYKITKNNKIKCIEEIKEFLMKEDASKSSMLDIYDLITPNKNVSLTRTFNDLTSIKNNIEGIETSIKNIADALEESIYGHQHAKTQILKIIAQWINGEQSGYSFGFEGSPGVGKTSLAKKGLANCLVDENGVPRPYAFIALGGSSTASFLEGYGYTYINSTWGKITDVLMESKCMNPIIYIDELDKISKTDQGREIIGILTHLIDGTQNDVFQDKYFNGIHLDLSKALFIFSYNDVDQIDKILLDRIHRIKFDNLKLDDKIIIARKYIIPEINKKMGFEDIIYLSDEIIEEIIEKYTCEPGVRKLKEIMFDLFGEVNIELLNCRQKEDITLPIQVTSDMLEKKYLNKYSKVELRTIHDVPKVGIINGLWANALGRGGITPIETMFFPSTTFFDLKLTGLQGDVMKESMNVAKSLAWNLTPLDIKQKLIKYFEETKCQGLHIHCPEGAVSKDGPSAGTAITIAIYSLFNEKPIKNNVAITGEINLQGEITKIGGLENKLYGGIKNGVKTFLFPASNKEDFDKFMKMYENKGFLEGVEFHEVKHITDVFQYVF
jgi:ATP-dependent Lon protease